MDEKFMFRRGEKMLRRYLAYCIVCIVSGFVISASAVPQTLSGDEIMKRVDKNKFYEKIEYNGKMSIRKGEKVRIKLMHVYAEGEEKALIEFTNPEDRGTKYLKLSGEMWIYFPDAEEIVKISGHMLRESMMGSDFSYEDVLENEELLKKYSVTVVGSETIGERDCYILELNAIEKKVTYAKRKLWVDKGRFVVLKTQLFALSGKLLKEIVVEAVEKYGDRYFATKVTMMNKLTKNTSTTFEMGEIDFDVDIPDDTFTRRSLET
jgi:outer membrane lipoprotein-sorting protein